MNEERYVVIGTTALQARAMFGVDDLDEVSARADEVRMRSYAVYRNDPGFHSSAQREFLVYHVNDVFWLNQGVESAADDQAA